VQRFLIVKITAIGDVVIATPVARELRRVFPDSHIAWLVDTRAAAGVRGNPNVDEIITFDAKSVRAYWRAVARLRRGAFDVAIDVQGLAKTALLLRATRIPERIGPDDRGRVTRSCYTKLVSQEPHEWYDYNSQVYLAALADYGVTTDDYQTELHLSDEDLAEADALWAEAGLGGGQPVLGLIPFTSLRSKEWAPEKYAEVATRLAAEAGFRPAVFGSASERARADELAGMIDADPVVLAGETSLGGAGACIARCDLVIGGDTGLTHYAFALRRPQVTIHGPGRLLTTPVGERATRVAAPCDLRPCSITEPCLKTQNGRPCMDAVAPTEVVDAALELMNRYPPGA
jgi:ADP-heptose:LPS heptosyltransferase